MTGDPVREFQDTLILRQGLIDNIAFEIPKISLQFNFPKHFEVQFNMVADYRVDMPLTPRMSIREWSASRDSEFLNALPERRRRHHIPPIDEPGQLCQFHITFQDGYLDVLAEQFVFMMVSR